MQCNPFVMPEILNTAVLIQARLQNCDNAMRHTVTTDTLPPPFTATCDMIWNLVWMKNLPLLSEVISIVFSIVKTTWRLHINSQSWYCLAETQTVTGPPHMRLSVGFLGIKNVEIALSKHPLSMLQWVPICSQTQLHLSNWKHIKRLWSRTAIKHHWHPCYLMDQWSWLLSVLCTWMYPHFLSPCR